jgi:glutamate 5-kinase
MVLKVGTNVLVDAAGGFAGGVLAELAASVARMRRAGRDVVLVSSGAVALGLHQMANVHAPPVPAQPAAAQRMTLDTPAHRAACAAAGQSWLTAIYHEAFQRHALPIAQILVTSDDFLDPDRSAGLSETLRQLLSRGIVPVVNENDAVSHHAGASQNRLFHDNDQLAALIAPLLDCKLLILLTDVDGLYTLDPTHADAELIGALTDVSDEHFENAGASGPRGRGGMRSKLIAVMRARRDPELVAVIANGRTPGVLDRIMAGEEIGTIIATIATGSANA